MARIIFFLALLSALVTAGAQDQTKGLIADTYEIEVSVFPSDSYISGRALIDLTGLTGRTMEFYLHGELRTDSVFLNDKKLDFNQERQFYYYSYSLTANKTKVNIEKLSQGNINEEYQLVVYYSGYFHPSVSRVRSDFMRIEKEGAWLRSYGYSLWFPVFLADGAESYITLFKRVSVESPSDFSSIMCGKRIKEYEEGNRRISVWAPGEMNIMDMQLVSSDYSSINAQNVYVYYFNNPKSKANSSSILDYGIRLKQFFEKNIKQSDLVKPLYIVEMPEYGDISSGNTTGIQSRRWQNFGNEMGPKITLAHEMVHEYVHVPVNWEDPLAAIVIEGFPNYYDLLAIAEVADPDYYKNVIIKTERDYLFKRKTGFYSEKHRIKLPEELPLINISFDDIGKYKDRFVLSDRIVLFMNYLRKSMGEDDFLDFTREIFSLENISYRQFIQIILKYLPDYEEEIKLWLETTDYQEQFLINN